MALPYTLTPGFTQAVDDLIHDAALSDSTLHSRSKQYLDVFNHTTAGQASVRPTWSERIHVPSPVVWPGSNPNNPPPPRHPFTTPGLFNAMYQVADELKLVGGKRYVSAAICVCAEHAAQAHATAAGADPEMRGALVRALHLLSSTWAAFLLWPFHAYGYDERFEKNDDDRLLAGDETPTAEGIARAQRRRHLNALVMARDDRRCFLSGGLDDSAYYYGMTLPAGVTRVMYCRTMSIIPAEFLASEPNEDFTWGILRRFCGIQDTTALAQKVHGPANMLFVHRGAMTFYKFLWWLLPTEIPNHYEIKNFDPVYNIGGGIPPPSHVTFADHSASASAVASGVDLPDRTLLRIHAALAEVFHRSGARNTFVALQRDFSSHRRWTARSGSTYSASVGGAFWRSVVEYEGPKTCAEAELREAVEALVRSKR